MISIPRYNTKSAKIWIGTSTNTPSKDCQRYQTNFSIQCVVKYLKAFGVLVNSMHKDIRTRELSKSFEIRLEWIHQVELIAILNWKNRIRRWLLHIGVKTCMNKLCIDTNSQDPLDLSSLVFTHWTWKKSPLSSF